MSFALSILRWYLHGMQQPENDFGKCWQTFQLMGVGNERVRTVERESQHKAGWSANEIQYTERVRETAPSS